MQLNILNLIQLIPLENDFNVYLFFQKMATSFPLLDSISKQIKDDIEISTEDKENMIKSIKKFDKNKQELVYGLIKAHFIESGRHAVGLPYEGQKMKTGPRFDLEKLPKDLLRILQKFVELNNDIRN